MRQSVAGAFKSVAMPAFAVVRVLRFATLLAGLSCSPALVLAQSTPTDINHRPLRENPLPAEEGVTRGSPAAPQSGFHGYPDAPAFSVVARIGELSFYPCSDCHSEMVVNPVRRALNSPHPSTLEHGDGRFWCLDCHDAEVRNQFHTLSGEALSFDRSDRVCAQCHGAVHRDWVFGAHGKRVARWQGERSYYACAHCHDPHRPAVRPRAPQPPPALRAGLGPLPGLADPPPAWWRWLPWYPAPGAPEENAHAR